MLIPSAYAQAAGSAPQSQGGLAALAGFAPFILIFVLFYFLMIRPQQKRQAALRDAVNAVKKGDQVVTAGGMVGKVTKVDETYVELEIAANTRVKVVKATLGEVLNPAAKSAND